MQLRDFVVGESFWTELGEFRCTDVGTRVVVAIKLGPTEVVIVDDSGETLTRLDEDPSWFDGPPYAVEEVVFDEDDQLVCFPTEAAMLADREEQPPSSSS
jgi:hypothetical protein